MTALLLLAAVVATVRFGVAVYRAPRDAKGDFAATLPGAYAKTLNPTLWSSPDLADSRGYKRDIYIYGPAQYLLLYPIVFLNSYSQIARALSVMYAGVLGLSLFLLARLIGGNGRSLYAALVIVAVALPFSPVYQTYIQREFEVVVFLSLVAATYLLVAEKEGWAGSLLGVITWFKLWPIAFLGYFLVTKRFKALAAFIVASCLTLGIAQLLFGLDRFVIFNPSLTTSTKGGQYILTSILPTLEPTTFVRAQVGFAGRGFCKNWYEVEETAVGMRWAVCRLAFSYRWLPPSIVFSLIGLVAAVSTVFGFVLVGRRDTLTEDERRSCIIYEMSLVTIAAALVLSAHYYYFIYLALPFSALAFRYLRDRRWKSLGWFVLAYLMLSVFLLPLSLTIPRLGVNLWSFYIEHVFYLYGELILIALLLREYVATGLRRHEPVLV